MGYPLPAGLMQRRIRSTAGPRIGGVLLLKRVALGKLRAARPVPAGVAVVPGQAHVRHDAQPTSGDPVADPRAHLVWRPATIRRYGDCLRNRLYPRDGVKDERMAAVQDISRD